MSNLTATPGLTFTADAPTGIASVAPTMPIAALAWSAEEEPVELVPAAVVPAMAPPPARRRGVKAAALAAVLFGVVTAGALAGAIMFGGNDSPAAGAHIVDRTASAPYVQPAAAPTSALTVSDVVVPAAAAEVTAPTFTAPKVVVPSAQPPAPVDHPTEHRGDGHHWDYGTLHDIRKHWDRQDHGNKQ